MVALCIRCFDHPSRPKSSSSSLCYFRAASCTTSLFGVFFQRPVVVVYSDVTYRWSLQRNRDSAAAWSLVWRQCGSSPLRGSFLGCSATAWSLIPVSLCSLWLKEGLYLCLFARYRRLLRCFGFLQYHYVEQPVDSCVDTRAPLPGPWVRPALLAVFESRICSCLFLARGRPHDCEFFDVASCFAAVFLLGEASVRITVFCSAIVIDVIAHCHTAGALLSQTAENNCPYLRVVGFLILSGKFIITLVAELGIQPLIRSFWTETSAITLSTFSIAVTVFPSSTYGGDLSLSVDGACIIAFSAQCTGL